MTKLECSVENCVHNADNCCCKAAIAVDCVYNEDCCCTASGICICGNGACDCENTRCATYKAK